jgi:tRNA (guanine37-N1)-methyltransferase
MAFRLDILTLFPELVESFLGCSLVGRARALGLLEATAWNIRNFADPPHYKVDDSPYGGGAGMVMTAEPIKRALDAVRAISPGTIVIYLSPAGETFNQRKAEELAKFDGGLCFLCGRYEGVDERVLESEVDSRISLGDFILMGGEVAAMAIMEAVLRLRPGVLGNEDSMNTESFALSSDGGTYLEAPQYTRPLLWRGQSVPDVLLSGDHGRIAEWRRTASRAITSRVRPDLFNPLSRREGVGRKDGE